jgi:hypothetical protein
MGFATKTNYKFKTLFFTYSKNYDKTAEKFGKVIVLPLNEKEVG